MRSVDENGIRAMERAAASDDAQLYGLMCRAGSAAVAWIHARRTRFRRVIVLAGGGNNGGDALVAARLLSLPVLLYAAKTREEYRGVAAYAAAELPDAIGLHPLEQLAELHFQRGDLVVDGLLGTGFHADAMYDSYRRAIEIVNAARIPVLALDLPSGLDCNTGEFPAGCAMQASATLVFGAMKNGLLLASAPAVTGVLELADIGLGAVASGGVNFQYCSRDEARALLPAGSWDAHKKSHGRIAVFAGSRAYPGAAALTATAALRAGAGLVRLCSPVRPEGLPHAVIHVPVPATAEGETDGSAFRAAAAALADSDVLAAGPGWGSGVSAELLEAACGFPGACVLDADALNLIARCPERWHAPERCVLTPHPGEAARLEKAFGIAPAEDRLLRAQHLAARLGAVVLLKGPRSVIAAPGGEVWINPTGCAALATAGSGDVLTGLIAALLGYGIAPLEAAVLGAWMHGVAGERGGFGLIADDLPQLLAEVWRGLLENSL